MWFDSYNYVTQNYDYLTHKHHIKLLQRGIFLDTAPLFILIVGHYDKVHKTNFIQEFQSQTRSIKDRSYNSFDYDYLISFLNSCGLGKRYNLFITPHIFTEFVKHLWEIVHNSNHFKRILEEFFKTKWYIKEQALGYSEILDQKLFVGKTLEVGDISLTILCKDKHHSFMTILTDDRKFAEIVEEKHSDFLVIYYDDIRLAMFQITSKNIPEKLLEEPTF